jgi:hypothetical protein
VTEDEPTVPDEPQGVTKMKLQSPIAAAKFSRGELPATTTSGSLCHKGEPVRGHETIQNLDSACEKFLDLRHRSSG